MDRKALRKEVLGAPIHWLAFGIPAGLAPFAPGTFGSLWGLAAAWLTHTLALWQQLALAGVAFLAGVYICGESARRLGIHDHSGIVWDEIVGCYLTAIAAISIFGSPTWLGFGLAFGLFRIFDIVKPPPIRDLDHRLKGGLGIMIDDVAAAVYSVLVLLIIQRVASV